VSVVLQTKQAALKTPCCIQALRGSTVLRANSALFLRTVKQQILPEQDAPEVDALQHTAHTGQAGEQLG
jgi:hypothetical protein